MERLGSAGEQYQSCDRWLGGCNPWGDGATEAVPEQEEPAWVDGWVLLEEVDRGDRLRQVLIAEREVVCVFQLRRVSVGDLVEAQHCDAAAGEAPGDVLEWFVAADRLVAVK